MRGLYDERSKHLTITFKSGYECAHDPKAKTNDDWWGMIADIMDPMGSAQGGFFVTQFPYGAHRVEDISAMHFGDVTPPPDTPAIGFRPPVHSDAAVERGKSE